MIASNGDNQGKNKIFVFIVLGRNIMEEQELNEYLEKKGIYRRSVHRI